MPDIRRVFAGVSGSPGSVPALRQAAELARHHGAILIPLHAWVPPEGDLHERKHPWHPELRQLWADDAWQRLWAALDAAFGGLPAEITTEPVVLRGKPGPVLTGAARRAGDLLVIGTGRRSLLRRLGWPGADRYCLAHACCPVLAIPPPALAQHAGHGVRGWTFRRHWIRATTRPAEQTTPPCPGGPKVPAGRRIAARRLASRPIRSAAEGREAAG
jgi:nucleotide-binding universal stress UspA family protein